MRFFTLFIIVLGISMTVYPAHAQDSVIEQEDDCTESPWTPVYSIQNISCGEECADLRIVSAADESVVYVESEDPRNQLAASISDACALPKVRFTFVGTIDEQAVDAQAVVDMWDVGLDRQVTVMVADKELDIRLANATHVNKFWYTVAAVTIVSLITLLITYLMQWRQRSQAPPQ